MNISEKILGTTLKTETNSKKGSQMTQGRVLGTQGWTMLRNQLPSKLHDALLPPQVFSTVSLHQPYL